MYVIQFIFWVIFLDFHSDTYNLLSYHLKLPFYKSRNHMLIIAEQGIDKLIG